MTGTAAVDARRLLRRAESGTLATASQRYGGHPFGSLVRFALDGGARPLILVSRLAEHTRNVEADPRVSLLALERGADAQADARVTVVGTAAAVPADEPATARYRRRFPDAADLLALGDFAFYRIEPLAVRYIAGFGRIHWLPAQALTQPDPGIAAAETALLAELARADLAALWTRYAGPPAETVAPCGIDADGVELRAAARLLRIDFAQPAADLAGTRAAVARLVRESVS